MGYFSAELALRGESPDAIAARVVHRNAMITGEELEPDEDVAERVETGKVAIDDVHVVGVDNHVAAETVGVFSDGGDRPVVAARWVEEGVVMTEEEHAHRGLVHSADHVLRQGAGEVDAVEGAHVAMDVVDGTVGNDGILPESLGERRGGYHSLTSLTILSRLPAATASLSDSENSAWRRASIPPPG